MKKMSEKKKKVYNSIASFIKQNGYSPTVRELCKILDLKAPATIHTHLKDLKEMQYITYEENKSRTIRVLKGDIIE